MVAANGDSGKYQADDQQQGTPEGLTLGQYLRNERERKKLSIEELHQKTGIHLTALRALEHDMRQELPADVFVRGFIKLYTQTLGLDPQAALKLFKEKNSSDGKGPESFVSRDILSSESLAESPLFTKKKLVVCFLFILLCFLGYTVYRYQPLEGLRLFPLVKNVQQTASAVKVQSSTPQQQNLLPQNNPAAEKTAQENTTPAPQSLAPSSYDAGQSTVSGRTGETAKEANPQIAPSPQPEKFDIVQDNTAATENKVLHTLTATFSKMTWVKTVVDNNETKEAFFRPGSSASWQGKEKIEIVLGNSGGVSLSFDGTPVNLHGGDGKVLRLSFP